MCRCSHRLTDAHKSVLSLAQSPLSLSRASLVAQLVKNPPALQETLVQYLGQEDPLQKEMATHSSILAWEIPWTEEPGGLQCTGVTKSWTQLSD